MKLKKRILSLLLCGAMLVSLGPQSVLAEENGQAGGVTAGTSGLCEHHPEHNADCGYTEETAGTPCGHEHTADCYEEVTNCVHEHNEDCYPEESVSGNEATPSGAQKREPTECTHVCSEESGCITKELNCQHEHNSECGYSPAAQGTPCGYVCELCGGEDSEKPAVPSNAEAVTVASVQAMIDALPGADEITDDNAEEVEEQLEAIDEAKAQLSDEETDELDFTRYMEAAAALGALAAPMLTTSGTGEVSTADALTSALADSANETVKLTADITIHATLSVNRTVTLDLNGHVLQYKNDEVHGSPLVVEDGAHLTIQDSGSNETHTFAPNSDGLWVLDENGSETVTGGVITGGTGYQYQKTHPNGEGYTSEVGGGVCVKSGGKLTMEGGNIVGCTTAYGYGGGVYVEGDFSMTGGSISGCTAKEGGGVGVGVWNQNATFDMSGNAVIRNCRCKSDSSNAWGGGVYALGKFTMSDNAAIRDCECITNSGSAWGGGVFVSHHNKTIEFTMSGSAVIENCKVTASSPNSWTTSYGGGVYVAEGSSLTLEDNTKIKDCSAENTSGGATYGGGIFVRGNLTIAGSAEVGENCTAGIGSGIYLEVLSYSSGSWNLYANGGVIAGEVVLNNSSNYGGTIKITSSNEGTTEFQGSVLNNGGTIEKGTFTGEVANNGTISGGEFTGTVTNNGTITGGKFTGTVINSESGTIAEGVSIPNLKFIVTFDNEGTKTQEIIDAGSKLTEPTAPTKEGYRFDGWYYDNSGTKTKWDFDTDKVGYAMTFTAKWEKTYTVTLHPNGGTINSGNVTEYTYGTGATLPTADDMTYTGHRFKGWYDNKSLTGSPVTAIGDTETGNKEYWAKWEATPNYLDLSGYPEFDNEENVTVNGRTYPIGTDGGRYVNLPETGDILQRFTYLNGTYSAAHGNYPTGMTVYRIHRQEGGATLERIDALDNLLIYSGCSIRISGKQGIRMITGITQDNKKALTSKAGLAGYTLEEYGTLICWKTDVTSGDDFSLDMPCARHNYAYLKGKADPVFAKQDGKMLYTNVLVGFSLEDCAKDLILRPYIKLKDMTTGETVTLYGGSVCRSIGYIAKQNADTYKPGSSGYKYVHKIIDAVYDQEP